MRHQRAVSAFDRGRQRDRERRHGDEDDRTHRMVRGPTALQRGGAQQRVPQLRHGHFVTVQHDQPQAVEGTSDPLGGDRVQPPGERRPPVRPPQPLGRNRARQCRSRQEVTYKQEVK